MSVIIMGKNYSLIIPAKRKA